MVRQWCIWCCVMQPSCPTNAHRCSCGAPRLHQWCSNGAPWRPSGAPMVRHGGQKLYSTLAFFSSTSKEYCSVNTPYCAVNLMCDFFGCQLSIEQSLDRPHTALRDGSTIQNTDAVCWKPVSTSHNKTTILQ